MTGTQTSITPLYPPNYPHITPTLTSLTKSYSRPGLAINTRPGLAIICGRLR